MRDKKATRHLENKKQNDRKKSHHISNYFKYKWIELSNQKTNWENGFKKQYKKTSLHCVAHRPCFHRTSRCNLASTLSGLRLLLSTSISCWLWRYLTLVFLLVWWLWSFSVLFAVFIFRLTMLAHQTLDLFKKYWFCTLNSTFFFF